MTLIPFDNRPGSIWWNGQLIPWGDAKLHLCSHGLHYASAVFEGERAYNGRIFKSTEHSQRLIDSAALLGMTVPYSAEELDAAKRETLAAQGFQDAYIRPIAWRGSEQMGVAAQATRINVAIAIWEWPSYFSPEARANGIKLIHAPYRRPDPATAPVRAKAAGLYMICTISKHLAESQGFHDALMLDWRGNVAEATGANFFMVKDGAVHTPPADCFLNGITRQTVMELARHRHIAVHERTIAPEELAGADEIFLTGTAAEVTAVGQIGELTFKVGPVTELLRGDYETLVRAAPQAVAAE